MFCAPRAVGCTQNCETYGPTSSPPKYWLVPTIKPPRNSVCAVTFPVESRGPLYAAPKESSSLAAAIAVALPAYSENGTSRSKEAQYSSTSSTAYSFERTGNAGGETKVRESALASWSAKAPCGPFSLLKLVPGVPISVPSDWRSPLPVAEYAVRNLLNVARSTRPGPACL